LIALPTIIALANHDEKSISYSEVRKVEEGWSIRSDFLLYRNFKRNSITIVYIFLFCIAVGFPTNSHYYKNYPEILDDENRDYLLAVIVLLHPVSYRILCCVYLHVRNKHCSVLHGASLLIFRTL
jgi:hypothetical protein